MVVKRQRRLWELMLIAGLLIFATTFHATHASASLGNNISRAWSLDTAILPNSNCAPARCGHYESVPPDCCASGVCVALIPDFRSLPKYGPPGLVASVQRDLEAVSRNWRIDRPPRRA